jgi:hypothetical protein
VPVTQVALEFVWRLGFSDREVETDDGDVLETISKVHL